MSNYLEDNSDDVRVRLEGDSEEDGEGRDGQDVIDARGCNDEGRDSLCNTVTFLLEGEQTGNNDRCKSKVQKDWETRICSDSVNEKSIKNCKSISVLLF